ncbi:hypothetical protein [Solwaraspora sp. WMMD792]|uniref:hypothetical protein n=1 Tax=Solwaraspora sp. WMMD792 TaxID=3016099 RepID=UPI002415EA10|nr:hypothetical protein [Solwaraspora sp. WMMD792]MDG4770677.1 hypothetical protein [Solwaraspora sp. WMMD792]
MNAGTVLRAAEALGERETFTREQVAHLLALAYQSGRADRHAAEVAELRASWTERPVPRPTREQRIRAEVDAMAAYAAAQETTWRGQYPGGPVDYETGRITRPAGAAA